MNRRYGWRHAAAVGLLANLASALPAGYNGDANYYDVDLRTPPGAPPGWVFAPAWAVNNALTLWSNLRVANLPTGTPGRRAVLASEAATWVLFASFSGLYFGLRSPVLGAVDTVAGLLTTTHGVISTARLDRPRPGRSSRGSSGSPTPPTSRPEQRCATRTRSSRSRPGDTAADLRPLVQGMAFLSEGRYT